MKKEQRKAIRTVKNKMVEWINDESLSNGHLKEKLELLCSVLEQTRTKQSQSAWFFEDLEQKAREI